MWHFPFVSRDRLEDVQRLLAESEAERKRLLDLLLPGVPKEPEPVKIPASAPSKESNMVAFNTPFDRLEKRVSVALKNGAVSQQFRAKAVR